ncbi:GHKL domain-containing protein [Paenibacillus spiritus]|uniref:GHKL domain-containing protein n=1 Tax=Paenibacillus spiritus TaxID=2496557 RepID=A0A5J5FXG8_9BACL|nr:GHKL domain-containing protein [Paenibacillus spiritus]KAA8998806.1 GHKL domain-containing protein [Paenibacillus spiritus]
MYTFLCLLIQILTVVLSAYVMLDYKVTSRELLILIPGSQALAYPLYLLLGTASIFVVLPVIALFLWYHLRRLMVSILTPVIALILLVLSDYVLNLVSILLLDINFSQTQASIGWPAVLYSLGILCLSILLSFGIRRLIQLILQYKEFTKKYGGLFLLLSVTTLSIFYINIFNGEQQGFSEHNIQANSLLFLFYFVLLIAVFSVLIRVILKETALKSRQEHYEQLMEYTSTLESMYREMQQFRHDYINILMTMSEYIRANDMNRLQAYFENKIVPISRGMQSNNFKLGALQNVKLQELKGILSSKLIQAQELGIDTVIEVEEVIESTPMDSVDLCRCIGIILDNAIEEAVQCQEPAINVALIKRPQSVLIVVSNSCRPDTPLIYRMYERGFSTKGSNRGLGLSTLREVVSGSREATLDTECRDGRFIQVLSMEEVS